MQELEEFIAEAEAGLKEEVEEGDYDALVRVMAKLVAVRDRQQVWVTYVFHHRWDAGLETSKFIDEMEFGQILSLKSNSTQQGVMSY